MKNRTFCRDQKSGRRRRRGGRARLFVLGAAFAASSAIAVRPAAALPQFSSQDSRPEAARSSQTFQFNIPEGSLESVVADFERTTSIKTVLANPDIGVVQSPGVVGAFTAEQAMTRLLMGTSVRATLDATGFSLDVGGVAEFVEVTGRSQTVSSPRYTVPLRDIAQTIAVIPRSVIEEQGATTLSDALRNVPGITLQAGEGGGASNTAGDMFNMRGFNASNSLFVDSVRDDGLISRDVYNVEQVEVFMGPTGSDVGRGTAAGYVNMQSKTPHLGSSSAASFGYGSADHARFTADFNLAAPSEQQGSWLSKSGFRLNALWQNSGVPGRDLVELESKAVAPSIALGLGTATRVTAAAQILRQDNLPDYGIPGAAWQDSLLAPTTVQTKSPVDQSNYYGSPGFDYDRASQDTYTARVEHDVNRNLTLRNQTRYNKTNRDAVITAIQNPAAYNSDTNFVTVARQGNERENSVVSNQTSVVDRFATGRLRHGVSLALEYAREEQFAPTLAGLGTRAPVDIFNPNPRDPIVGYAPTRTLANSQGATNTIALFAFDTVELNSRWQVSGGLRWEHYNTEFRAVDAAGLTTTNLAGADSVVSGKAGVLFRASETGNVYFSYGTTVTPPGAANFTLSAQTNNQNNPSVKPQESANVELGTKWDVAGGRLSLTGAVFHTENKNVIFTVDAAAIPPVYNQDDGQIVNGVTFGAMGRITPRWEVLANIGYLDTELETQVVANNGNRLLLTPAFSGSIWTTYELPKGLTLGGGIRHTDAVFINAANTIQSPGYHIVDGLVEYALNSNLSLRLNVYNLTNETYIRNVNNNGGRYNPGNPRSAVVTTQFRF